MTVFDQYRDTPYQIQNEGEQITVNFKRLSETTGEITWSLPNSTGGCSTPLVYSGALITIDDTPVSVEKFPNDYVRYKPDPSADPNTHLGDRLSTALVVGFIEDPLINTLTVVDLLPNKPYFVTVHALSNVLTYHTAGVHSYSAPYLSTKTKDVSAYQLLQIGQPTIGVNPSQTTGINPANNYTITFYLDNNKPYELTIPGALIQTYEQFVNYLNMQGSLVKNPLISPTIPNINHLWFNASTNVLSQWNGLSYSSIPIIISDTQPNIQQTGDLWYKPSTKILYTASVVASIVTWTPTPYIVYPIDPRNITCGYLWSNGTDMFKYDGNAWMQRPLYIQIQDPTTYQNVPCGTYWYNQDDGVLYKWDDCKKWIATLAQLSDNFPNHPNLNHLWFNDSTNELKRYDGSSYQPMIVTISNNQPTIANGTYWYNPHLMELKLKTSGGFVIQQFLLWHQDPLTPTAGTLWWESVNDVLYTWDDYLDDWVPVTNFIQSVNDPSIQPIIEIDSYWTVDGVIFKHWDGSEWVIVNVVNSLVDPHNLPNNTIWYVNGVFNKLTTGVWVEQIVLFKEEDPSSPLLNDYWYNSLTNLVMQFNGFTYVSVPFSTNSLVPLINYEYFDSTLNKLRKWNGSQWVDGIPSFSASFFNNNQYIRLITHTTGSTAKVQIGPDASYMTGTGVLNYQVPDITLFNEFIPPIVPIKPVSGKDGLTGNTLPTELGVGTDGSTDERRELIDSLRHQLGYPTIEVELTKQQFNYAIDTALESFRKRSSMAFKRGFLMIDFEPHVQKYQLTDKTKGYNKIVEVVEIHRLTTAYLSNTTGQGAYGQIFLQNLYRSGSFDLLSFHLVSQYLETMEAMFASKIMFNWNNDNRTLQIYKDLHKAERALMEVVVMRTEQDMMRDMYLKSWIEKRALVECRLMLFEIRGKYNSLPGSGGGVSLNGAEQAARADLELAELYQQIDDYIVNDPETWGMSSSFVLG